MSLLSAMDGRFAPAQPAAGSVGTASPVDLGDGLRRALGRVFARIRAYLQEQRDAAQLQAMDEAMLRDIGLDRATMGLGYRQSRILRSGRLPMFVALAAVVPLAAACSGGPGPIAGVIPACGYAGMRGMGGRAPIVAVQPSEACRAFAEATLARRPAPGDAS